TCGQYTDIARWFPNGKLYFSYKLLSGKKHGDYYHHAINGQVLRKGSYVNNEEEGIWQTYYETGKPETSGVFLHGSRDSTWLYHYENGKISSTTEYDSDERHGISKIYSPDGMLILEKLFFQGNFMAYRKMRSDGIPQAWETFTGNNTIVLTNPNGKKVYEENFKNGVVEGVKRTYYNNGNLYSEYRYVSGDYSGDYVVYFENGKLLEKGSYKLDELHGPVERYNEDGTLRSKEHFVLGTREGKSLFFKNGTKAIEFNFYGGMTHD
ncbi:MAG: hypothetical protein C0490_04550, partial [Marivirga sp.]|nr:hypothetical protein [Marivirga sp.]